MVSSFLDAGTPPTQPRLTRRTAQRHLRMCGVDATGRVGGACKLRQQTATSGSDRRAALSCSISSRISTSGNGRVLGSVAEETGGLHRSTHPLDDRAQRQAACSTSRVCWAMTHVMVRRFTGPKRRRPRELPASSSGTGSPGGSRPGPGRRPPHADRWPADPAGEAETHLEYLAIIR